MPRFCPHFKRGMRRGVVRDADLDRAGDPRRFEHEVEGCPHCGLFWLDGAELAIPRRSRAGAFSD